MSREKLAKSYVINCSKNTGKNRLPAAEEGKQRANDPTLSDDERKLRLDVKVDSEQIMVMKVENTCGRQRLEHHLTKRTSLEQIRHIGDGLETEVRNEYGPSVVMEYPNSAAAPGAPGQPNPPPGPGG